MTPPCFGGGAPHPPGPFPFGHECVAEVIEVGADVVGVAPGQRVVVPFQLSCGFCDRCTRGLTGRCRTHGGLPMYGLGALGGDRPGMLVDLLEVPYADAMLVEAPPGVPVEALASLSDNVPDAWRTVAPALRSSPSEDVLIVGGGAISIGLYAIAIARALGTGDIHYVDDEPARREQAERLGARTYDTGDKPPKCSVTVDASGTTDGLLMALARTDIDGLCTSASIYFEPVEMPLLAMYSNGVRFITGRPHVRTLLPEVIETITSGAFDPLSVDVRTVSWSDAVAALSDPADKMIITR